MAADDAAAAAEAERQSRPITAVVTAALVATGVAGAATAAPVATSSPQVSSVESTLGGLATTTPQQVNSVAATLDAAGVPSVTSPLIGTVRTTYTLPTGGTVVVERPRLASGTVSPQFSVGAGWGLYIYLTRDEQLVLVAGGAIGLGVLICGSTTVVGCAAASAALGAAAQWINNRGGVCSKSSPRLEIRFFLGSYFFKCLK